jgi:hypothetical protein
MKQQLLSLGLSLGLTLLCGSETLAVPPAPVKGNSDVAWSQVVNDPFDGQVVYDKHFRDGFEFITSWSKGGIRATYSRFWRELVGYKTVWRSRNYYDHRRKKHRRETYSDQEPVYQTHRQDYSLESILIAVNGKVYTYTGGSVTPELATALATAPVDQNVRVRIVLPDESTEDMEIGKGTVAAWRIIFAASSKTATRSPE